MYIQISHTLSIIINEILPKSQFQALHKLKYNSNDKDLIKDYAIFYSMI